MGKSDRSMLRHLAFQVGVEIVCSLNQRQGMLSAGMSDGVLRTWSLSDSTKARLGKCGSMAKLDLLTWL